MEIVKSYIIALDNPFVEDYGKLHETSDGYFYYENIVASTIKRIKREVALEYINKLKLA